MTRFGCTCGEIIHLTEFPNPNSGSLISDPDRDMYYERVSEDVAGFIQAAVEGRRREWIAERYSVDLKDEGHKLVDAVLTLPDTDIIEDILIDHRKGRRLAVVHCPYCGRLWVQEESGENRYRSFKPEGEWKDTLLAHKTQTSKPEETG